jgi:hypothetical protein
VIDDWIDPDEWPSEVQRTAALFEQGDLVEKPSFFYVGSARFGVWRFTREVGDASLKDEIFELDPEDSPPYGMITTETCDLVEESGKPRIPWVSVAPVYRLTNLDANSISLLSKKRVAYMRKLTAPRFTNEIWVVDVRIEFPVEKSWLVGRPPIKAFQSEADQYELASFLARRRERPVLSDDLHKHLLTPMRRWLERLKTRREEVLAGIKEIRLAISGNPLRPDGAYLIVIGNGPDLAEGVIAAWNEKWAIWRSALEQSNIDLVATMYTDMDRLSARTYDDSYRVPVSFSLF